MSEVAQGLPCIYLSDGGFIKEQPLASHYFPHGVAKITVLGGVHTPITTDKLKLFKVKAGAVTIKTEYGEVIKLKKNNACIIESGVKFSITGLGKIMVAYGLS